MDKQSVYYLISQYPTISGFILACYRRKEFDKLWNFLHELELHEGYSVH